MLSNHYKIKTFLPLSILIFISLFNTACTSFTNQPQPVVDILYTSPDRISFQGKGAGAGMALMSTMGPVGIALGVAIDEGIAKEIRETAVQGVVDFKVLFQNAVQQIENLKSANKIEVKRYGFVIKDGSKDYVAAEIILDVHYQDNTNSLTLSSWPSQQANQNWVTLDEVKTQSNKIEELFVLALTNREDNE